MAWLNALLAFSLAMIIFCTMASAVQELIQHVLRMREGWLQRMVVKFVEDTIHQKFPGVDAKALATQVLQNRAVDPMVSRKLAWIEPKELFTRLGESDVGKQVAGLGTREAARLWNDWSHTFDRLQTDATTLFATRAQTISVIIALGLALALNVDAVRLFNAFLTDDQLTARVLGQAQAFTSQFRVKPVVEEVAAQPERPSAGERANHAGD